MITVYHGAEILGHIVASHWLTPWEALQLIGVDASDPGLDLDRISVVYA